MHVIVVRQNRASSIDTAECDADVVSDARIEFTDENTPVRFSPETAFI
jgi:hypothetical protein